MTISCVGELSKSRKVVYIKHAVSKQFRYSLQDSDTLYEYSNISVKNMQLLSRVLAWNLKWGRTMFSARRVNFAWCLYLQVNGKHFLQTDLLILCLSITCLCCHLSSRRWCRNFLADVSVTCTSNLEPAENCTNAITGLQYGIITLYIRN